MSIVEKAINSAGKGVNQPRTQKLPFAKDISERGEVDAEVSIVDVHDLGSKGMTTILENHELSKSFRFLKRSVLARIFGSPDSDSSKGKQIMVTSAMPHAGKSFMAFNLAASIAQEQLINVVLIDADIVRCNLTELLGVSGRTGLVEALTSNDLDASVVETSLSGLSFIPSGKPHVNGTELLASNYMSGLLDALEDPDTVIVMDTTPLLVTSEADAVAAHVDHVIVVVEAGNTPVEDISRVIQMLEKSNSKISFIMNKVAKITKPGGAYDYQYSK